MIAAKAGMLILYVLLIFTAIDEPLSLLGNISQGVLVLVAALHLLECLMYRDIIRRAPGSATWHMTNILLFGVLHMIQMKLDIRNLQEDSS
jgi:uncharacterized protein YhhL (DUF1145 family)